jgi:HicB family
MSRPKVYDEPRVATAIRLPTSLHEELQSAATQRDVSVNFLVTRAVSSYLAQLPPVDADLPSQEEATT